MSVLDKPDRKELIFRACGWFVLAGAMGVFLLVISSNPLIPRLFEKQIAANAFIVLSVLMGAWNVWFARRTPAEATTAAWFADRGRVRGQLSVMRWLIWLFAVGLPLVGIWIAFDLDELERGYVHHVQIVEPVGFLYEHLGHWPAVLFLPVLSLIGSAVLLRKLRSLHDLLRSQHAGADFSGRAGAATPHWR
jgi:hypothetical protein